MTDGEVTFEFPPRKAHLEPALALIGSYADEQGIAPERRGHLIDAARMAVSRIIENNAEVSGTKIEIGIYEKNDKLCVAVRNHGLPLFAGSNGGSAADPRVHAVAGHLDELSWENLGRGGQTVVLGIKLGGEAAKRALGDAAAAPEFVEPAESEIVIRRMEPGEADALSRLFYFVYGYDYINESIYYPEKVKAMLDQGKLVSVVAATKDGRLLGHVGLMRQGEKPPVYEPCLGVVDPRLKSRGLFGKIFARTMEIVGEYPMDYLFFDFVTNHEYSQKFVGRYHPVDLAIFVGCQTAALQAKLEKLGIGKDPKETDRYSLLYSILPRVAQPFGKEIELPMNLGELLGFLLKPLNLTWYPASRFQVLPEGGEYRTELLPAQNAVVFDLVKPGREAADKIVGDWHRLMRNGYQYAGVEVKVGTPGLGNLYDHLAAAGFFVAGFAPYHHGGELALRFQAMGPTKVSFDEIKVWSPTAKELLAIIRQNYERNQIL